MEEPSSPCVLVRRASACVPWSSLCSCFPPSLSRSPLLVLYLPCPVSLPFVPCSSLYSSRALQLPCPLAERSPETRSSKALAHFAECGFSPCTDVVRVHPKSTGSSARMKPRSSRGRRGRAATPPHLVCPLHLALAQLSRQLSQCTTRQHCPNGRLARLGRALALSTRTSVSGRWLTHRQEEERSRQEGGREARWCVQSLLPICHCACLPSCASRGPGRRGEVEARWGERWLSHGRTPTQSIAGWSGRLEHLLKACWDAR